MRTPFLAVIVAGSLLLVSCTKNEDDQHRSSPKADDAAIAKADEPGPTATPPGSAEDERDPASIGMDEVRDMIPVPTGARVVEAPKRAQVGARIEAAYCLEKGELESSSESLKTQLQEAGWQKVVSLAHPTMAERISINGFRPDGYVMTGAMQRAARDDCPGDKGMTFITLTVHRRQSKPGEGAPAPVAPSAASGAVPNPTAP